MSIATASVVTLVSAMLTAPPPDSSGDTIYFNYVDSYSGSLTSEYYELTDANVVVPIGINFNCES